MGKLKELKESMLFYSIIKDYKKEFLKAKYSQSIDAGVLISYESLMHATGMQESRKGYLTIDKANQLIIEDKDDRKLCLIINLYRDTGNNTSNRSGIYDNRLSSDYDILVKYNYKKKNKYNSDFITTFSGNLLFKNNISIDSFTNLNVTEEQAELIKTIIELICDRAITTLSTLRYSNL